MLASQHGLRLAVFVAAVALTGAQALYPLQFAVDTRTVTARWFSMTVESTAGLTYTVPGQMPPPGPGARLMTIDTPYPADGVRSVVLSASGGEWDIASLALNGAPWTAATATGGAVVGSDPVEFANLVAGPIIVAVQTGSGQYSGTYATFALTVEAGGYTCSQSVDGSKYSGGEVQPSEVVVLMWWCNFRPEEVEELKIEATGAADGWDIAEVRMYRPATHWCTMNVAGTTTQLASTVKASVTDSVEYVCLSTANGCSHHLTAGSCAEEYGCHWSAAGFCYHQCPLHYYGSGCTTFCDAAVTCTGKGSCDRNGKCECTDGYGGADCNSERHTCTSWGDPHYTAFSGQKFDFQGTATASVPGAYVVYSLGRTTVLAQHYQCRGTTSKPKSCMEQIQITSVGGTVVTILMDNDAGTEKGLMHVTSPAGASYTTDVSALNTFPVPVGDITLVSYRELNRRDGEFTFELPAENGFTAEVKVTQARSEYDNLPWVDLEISHFGSMVGASGLCTENCGQSDCTATIGERWTTGTRLPGPPPLPVTPSTGCAAHALGPQWADTCCSPLRTCAGEALYKQCVTENCQMAWAGTVAASHCVDSFARILLDGGLCEQQLCPGNRGGSGCLSCQQGYFGPDCNKYCDPAVTCNGHGSCNGAGDCWCDAGYTAVDPVTGIQCQAPGAPPATLPPVAVPTPAPTAAATLAPAPAGEGEGGPVCALFDTCTHDPNCCVAGSACMEFTEYYAQCREDCPTGWACAAAGVPIPTAPTTTRPEDCLALYPSGILDGGACTDDPMCCADGLTCYEYGDSYAACMPDCTLAGWRCTIRL